MTIDIYPLTIIRDRYQGAYSGGLYTAFNLECSEVPQETSAEDSECFNYWESTTDIYGLGQTPDEAMLDLAKKLK
jgi:hypothetical protein